MYKMKVQNEDTVRTVMKDKRLVFLKFISDVHIILLFCIQPPYLSPPFSDCFVTLACYTRVFCKEEVTVTVVETLEFLLLIRSRLWINPEIYPCIKK